MGQIVDSHPRQRGRSGNSLSDFMRAAMMILCLMGIAVLLIIIYWSAFLAWIALNWGWMAGVLFVLLIVPAYRTYVKVRTDHQNIQYRQAELLLILLIYW